MLARSEISRFGFDVSDSILCSPKENAALLVVSELIMYGLRDGAGSCGFVAGWMCVP